MDSTHKNQLTPCDVKSRAGSLLTTGQAAQLCSVTPDTILKWIKKGRLKGTRTAGGHYRVDRQDLEPFMGRSRVGRAAMSSAGWGEVDDLRCWEYLSDRGRIRDECRQCVVYQVRAARCFVVAGLDQEVGHARRFCEVSCEECAVYLRVNCLAAARKD